ncbi:asparagine synthase (glutamine-hydrolysing) [Bhargavaea ginsengi]|uniref:asparagine synthase (glutamine-hydrolyzing) n=1 Tax=Bhargavaea ginsengi TaxID=426757 RepID=A0A1H6XXK6_9BACL|nr:asparagine synthase (glutamine-hydrolyzing) [Bhargavaea ginsengi]SEJ29580.1 asparagine synthase (glutamine-hydrolysing) [Bhargavaea ginsengi]
MCGITGWADWKQDLRQQVPVIQSMAATLSRRGPDALNTWCSKHMALGHTRLTVVDPAGGAQPMTKESEGRTYRIVYNGELYNTEELRKELIGKGYPFHSRSDTEVLLTAYIEWGERCLERLNGIFAFGIWDETLDRLFLARDRLGVKPLFYLAGADSLMFASEIKAILKHPQIKAQVDRDGLREVFGLGPSRSPGNGIFRGIDELPSAHALTFDKSGIRKWRYWNVESRNHDHDLAETLERVSFLVKDAIRRQLIADVPVCTFLSGGLDSSIISAVASEQFRSEGRGRLNSYSIDYEQNLHYFKSSVFQPDQDAPWIEKVSDFIGTDHHSKVIDQQTLVNGLDRAVLVRDLPGMADVDASLLWFCEQIRQDHVVALSGECADEIFGGYPWFHRSDLLQESRFPWMTSQEEREVLLQEDWRKKLSLKEYIQYRYDRTIAEVPVLDGEDPTEARRREMFYLNMTWFMSTLLERKDRMSMGAGLEVRVPFADHRIVEYAWNIPWDMKMLDGREKGLLRRAMEGILPTDILYRKKSPYPKTHHPAYMRLVKEKLQDILGKPSPLWEIISRRKVEEILNSDGASFKTPWFGQLMTAPQLIAHLSQIHTWFDHYGIDIVDS